jgi:hypothetical protein
VTTNQQQRKMQVNCWMWWYNAGHIPNGAHPVLQEKPLDAVEFSHRIAAAAAMVNNFGRKHKTLKRNIFC